MMTKRQMSVVWLFAIQLVFGYEWLFAAWEKLATGGVFVKNMPVTLGRFAEGNPFGWYKTFLLGFATKNATTFGYLVEYGQLLIGIALIVMAFVLLFIGGSKLTQKLALKISALSYFFGAAMNAVFWLAAAWTSPATRGVNAVMFWVQVILICALCKMCRQIKKEN